MAKNTYNVDGAYKEDIILVECCGRIKCQELLYRLTSKLRVIAESIYRVLNISQKVETSDEKIRKFFPYWLELCSRTAEKLALQEGSPSDRRLLIVFMDAHMVGGPDNERVHPNFWLPYHLPTNIKLLMTVDQDHRYGYFGREAYFQPVNLTRQIKLMPQYALKRRMKPAYYKILTSMLTLKNKYYVYMLYNYLYINVEGSTIFQDVFLQIMNFWLDKSILTQSSLQVIAVLSCCLTGLSMSEVCSICCISSKEFRKLTIILPIICTYKDIFYIPEECMKYCLREALTVNRKDTHVMIAKRLKPMQCNLRKLLYYAYHLLHGCCFFELKYLISRADSFLILYNWQTKYELFHMWRQLETECHFDPVFEYNRSLTSYQLHCYPSDDNLFKLLVQLSRFFIEYADYYMFGIPVFRHPLIKGTEAALNRMHLLQYLKNREMLLKKYKPLTDKYQPYKSLKSLIEKVVADLYAGRPIGPITYPIKSESLQYAPYPREIVETMNVEIVNNRSKFEAYYINKLYPYIKILQYKSNSNHHHLHNPLDYADYGAYEQEMFSIAMYYPSYYYYRQWLWIQLPWLSLTLYHDFSQMIRGCLEAGSIGYMSVQEYDQLTYQAAAISLYSYLKKFDGGRMPLQLKITKETRRAKSKVTEIEDITTNRYLKLPTEIRHEMKKNTKGTMSIGRMGTFITGVVDSYYRYPLPYIKTQRYRNAPDALTLKRYLNSYTYYNQMLLKRLYALQLRQQTTYRSLEYTRSLYQLQITIQLFQQKCKEQRYQLAKSIIYQDKLNTIINICGYNAVHNTECTGPMQRYLSNLKIMIEVVKENIKKEREYLRLFEQKLKKSHHQQHVTPRVEKVSPKQSLHELPVLTECDKSIDSMISDMYDKNGSMENSVVQEAPPKLPTITADSPELKKFIEVCAKKQYLQQRTLELETNKENIQNQIKQIQIKIKTQGIGSKSLPTTKRVSTDKTSDLKKYLYFLRLRKAELSLFLETVQPTIEYVLKLKNA